MTEAEAEASSIWNEYQTMRDYLNQLYTRVRSWNPPNIEYHHLVEQSEEEASGFSVRAINSMANVVPTPANVHAMISQFYSQAQAFLQGGTVREWMETQTWEVQWEEGLKIWKEAMTSNNIYWRPPGLSIGNLYDHKAARCAIQGTLSGLPSHGRIIRRPLGGVPRLGSRALDGTNVGQRVRAGTL